MSPLVAQTWPIIRNDLRLCWRELQGGSQLGAIRRYGPLVVLVLLLHAPIVSLMFGLKTPPSAGAETFVWLIFVLLMLGAAMARAAAVLYERSDFDLLLSSPLPFQAVLLARLCAISLVAFFAVSLLVLPLIDGAMLALSPRYAASFLVWASLAAIAGAVGTAFMLGLARSIGARRARVIAQFLAMTLSLGIGLMFVLPVFLGPKRFKVVQHDLAQLMQDPVFTAVGRADRGAPLELGVLVLLALAALALVVKLMARTFAAGVQEAAAAGTSRRGAALHRWTAGCDRAAFRKELRLIGRSPKFFGPVVAVVLIIGVMGAGFVRLTGPRALAPFALVLASQLAFVLAEIAASGEVCGDLARLSPASESRLRGVKMLACMAGPLALAAIMCGALAVNGRPWIALVALLSSAVCAAGNAWIGVTTVQPQPRQDVLQSGSPRKFDARQLATLLLLYSGAGGIGLLAFDLRAWGALLLGVMFLSVLACFTLIEPRGPEGENS